MASSQFIVGGASYPLPDWVLVPYSHRNLTWTLYAFNERVGEARDVAREASARLKRRWGFLQKRTEVKLHDLPVLLGARCVLHNVCEMRKEEVGPEDGVRARGRRDVRRARGKIGDLYITLA
ncbi:U-box domain-containing protein 52-like [Iris pallida]|uniref:U-box domain-containing protein 52-like n=1 Tax=Iris pallida TaxID=29817 RepID=A0AAX6FKD3_IRIPA|nr:U-box domain-containing protein 52-like [Iris pallida]